MLGIWAAPTEGAKFWLTILTALKNRGVEDIFFICADGLTGLDEAVEAAFPTAVMLTCIVHLIRAALRFVSWADRKAVAGALKPLYTAENEDPALLELEKHEHGDKYPTVIRTFRGRWEQFVPFHSYPQEIRRMLYTTNAVESLNAQLRKVLRNRGPFPARTPSSRSSSSRDRMPRRAGERARTGPVSSLSSTSFSKDVCLRESSYTEDLTRSVEPASWVSLHSALPLHWEKPHADAPGFSY